MVKLAQLRTPCNCVPLNEKQPRFPQWRPPAAPLTRACGGGATRPGSHRRDLTATIVSTFHALLRKDAYRSSSGSMIRQLLADARFYQRLTRAESGATPPLAWTMLCNRGLWLLTFHRIAYYCVRRRNGRGLLWWSARVVNGFGTFFSVVFCKSAFIGDCEISGPAYLSNRGYLICGARSIGAGSLIHDRCSLGYAVARRNEGRPVIGSNVWIGPNCVIGGAVTVGDGATVLPGSFLTYSVPAGAVVKGNPATIVGRDFDNSVLRRSLAIVQDVTTACS
jgi:serine acetyltransferase